MKTNVVVTDQGKRPATNDPEQHAKWRLQTTPIVMANCRGGIVQYAVWFMRLLGITKIMIKQTLIGGRSVSDVGFKAMMEMPPEELRVCRNTMIRGIADMLTMVGVLEIEILPDEKEMASLTAFWEGIQKPPVEPAKKDMKLNTETDPTGDKVITNGDTINTEPAGADAAVVAVAAGESTTQPVTPVQAGDGVRCDSEANAAGRP